MATFTEKEFKSVLNVRKIIDSWFYDKYSINPYNGCQFGCVYCDSRSGKYHLPDDFENEIIIKKNIAQMLDSRITKARTLLPDVIGIGGTTDPYQPAEAAYHNTAKCLEVILKHGYAVHLATKSDLVLRDIGILNDIAEKSWCTVSITITTSDREKASFLERKAPAPEKRFHAIETIKKNYPKIQCGILLMPQVPGLTDDEATIEGVIKRGKECGADYVLFGGGMTLRDKQAVYFFEYLDRNRPELIELFENIYHFKYDPIVYGGNYTVDQTYHKKISDMFFSLCVKHNMKYRINRFIPDDFRKYNYILSETMFNKAYDLDIAGKESKHYFWAGVNLQSLKESVSEIISRNELKKIRGIGAVLEKEITSIYNSLPKHENNHVERQESLF